MVLIGRGEPRPCLAIRAFAQPQAQSLPMTNEVSGLAVLPPSGYAVPPIAPNRTKTARFKVKKPDDRDTGC
ncbi:hypothetical protein D9599_25575 [Roseomonas sp. KE2513]|nr:hypothetical protein [Roseomonas sp. KE2513]